MEFYHSGNSLLCYSLDLSSFYTTPLYFLQHSFTAREHSGPSLKPAAPWWSLTWCCCLCTNEDGMVKGLRVYRLCSQGFKDLSRHKSRGIKLLSHCSDVKSKAAAAALVLNVQADTPPNWGGLGNLLKQMKSYLVCICTAMLASIILHCTSAFV